MSVATFSTTVFCVILLVYKLRKRIMCYARRIFKNLRFKNGETNTQNETTDLMRTLQSTIVCPPSVY
ncbi:hypothetical protein HanXRQr2_Chr11g0496501 [Helianthus annuus]|uniref:Uncharacterized protein n=1 Tax=Helianthus annuus TaxID=4232 RepID=A0A251TC73_HELAN|nr:hypothetical protein HanXRQr2_Chr11g0496501 [Helianthus annuus]